MGEAGAALALNGLAGVMVHVSALIVAGVRTAVGKAPRGALRTTRPDDMAAEVIAALLRKTPGLSPDAIDDVNREFDEYFREQLNRLRE